VGNVLEGVLVWLGEMGFTQNAEDDDIAKKFANEVKKYQKHNPCQEGNRPLCILECLLLFLLFGSGKLVF
jgi:hypothetical protein